VIGVPTTQAQMAPGFVRISGFPMRLSPDNTMLRGIYKFGDPPYAIALENGRQKAVLPIFDEAEPAGTLRRIGFIE
jgi:hypothetical protein